MSYAGKTALYINMNICLQYGLAWTAIESLFPSLISNIMNFDINIFSTKGLLKLVPPSHLFSLIYIELHSMVV
jgi:hypothetical protein